MWGKAFFLAALTKWASQTVSYPSLNRNFKRLIPKLYKWHLTAPVFIHPNFLFSLFFFSLSEMNWYINAYTVLEILFGKWFFLIIIIWAS